MTTTFNILGPLEVLDGEDSVSLNGMIQRATLGYLLLYANKVVATSELLRALWGADAPPTARKMLQNAVSGLRRALPSAPGHDVDRSGLLVTHAPGYLLRVDRDSVDLCRFEDLARKGRAAVAGEAWDDADRYLGDALALWRGPVLADLAENGYEWPECNGVQNTWYAVQEDRAQAALSTGRHLELIGELEPLVGADPLRERLCAQLMLALYRSGRQADALSVYRRTRSALVGKLGLDPGRELADLERAILDHDPTLIRVGERRAETAVPAARAEVPAGTARPPAEPPAVMTGKPPRKPPADEAEEPARPAPAASACTDDERPAAERKWVSAILVRAGTGADDDPEVLDQALRRLNATVADQVHRFGGVRHDSLGPVLVALFGTEQTKEDDAQRAVRAAMAVRDEVAAARLPQAAVAVVAGEALVVRSAGGARILQVTGAVP
ncbi:BTAD domain-containing putative transcriptional regulator [Kutzneria sp. 744]|uniref:BTAD domain-containing putative transcriptional regulator n=1 Tax=Kutzneria sp. (strain 744) TaxID=345341 RepID=UPI0004B8BBD9|nr:BTAD domain-containing putative transcriptional regulator [Kutzneria sp. 744]